MILEGTIVKIISNLYTVDSNNESVSCRARGRFRHDKTDLLVGDKVVFDRDKKYIIEVKERKNFLDRPNVANVDYALIVTSLKEPRLSTFLLDKLISQVIIKNVKPVICFTKEDLLNNEEKDEINKLKKYYESIDIKCFYNYEVDAILDYLQNKIVVLAGQTGAGKSSFLNRCDETLNLKTSPISKALNRGVHTTRHTELYKIRDTFLLDTPGFSSLSLDKYTKEEIKNSFYEFRNLHCLYKDCDHVNTEGCAINEVLGKTILESRFKSYEKMLSELKGRI